MDTSDHAYSSSSREVPSQLATHDLALNYFVDIDLDRVGIYALGHHAVDSFLGAVKAREPLVKIEPDHLRHTWIRVHQRGFEEFATAHEGSQAATILELNNYALNLWES